MRALRGWVLAAGVLAAVSAFGMFPVPGGNTETNATGADSLWAGMFAFGMIDEEQYQYVLENGCLPGNSTVADSPLTVESQTSWNKLAQQEVITTDELAAMLFDGDAPGLSAEEEKAFEELAPVYRKNRAQRLTYDVRRKHARVELIRLIHRFRAEHEARTANLEERAAALGFPLERGEAVLVGIDENDDPIYIVSDGIGACDTISADEVWTTNAVGNINTNFNLSGAGISLAMWEKGSPNVDHEEFGGRITLMTTRQRSSHANTVAAIMIGAGIETNAQGVAPQATLHAYSYDDALYTSLLAVASNGVIHFSNHSYHFDGVQKNGIYTDLSFDRDETVYTAYYHLPIMTVSNLRNNDPDGYKSMANGVAKNVLSVGAVAEITNGYAGASSVLMADDSGWGPTEDGRIKPDVVAGGWSGYIPLTNGYSNYYSVTYDGRTSYAAPAVTGGYALLQELHERLYGSAAPWLASTWKALLIHTADEAGDAPGPDYEYGWGLVNVLSAAELIAEDALWGGNHFIKEFMLTNGATLFFQVELDGSEPLTVTMATTDYPGPTLVNDLDLRIIGPGPDDTVYYPYVLNPDIPTNSATTGDNFRDNVEQVVVTNPDAGLYTVIVDHKGTLVDEEGDESGQAVSMIISENTIPYPTPDPTLNLSVSTNGLPLLEWEAEPGVVQVVMSKDKLTSPWMTNLTKSIIRVTNEWVDPTGFLNHEFYKIKEIQ